MKQLMYGENIIKSFGNGGESHNVLDGVSMEMKEGEFVAVMGTSGSGKSTLLYAMSGMEQIDSGRVCFEDADLSELSEDSRADLRRRRMGFVFQQPTLLKNLNILDNILLPQLRDSRGDLKELAERARHLMKRVGIEGLEQRDITQASGGQLQRAGICRALMGKPSILFADEPTGALNSSSAEEILNLFQEIHREGTAILLVTHDCNVAARAQRVLFMRDGRLLDQLPLESFRESDLGARAKAVMGQMKRLEI